MKYEPVMPISFKHFAKQGKSLEECLQFAKYIEDGTFKPMTKEEWLVAMKKHYKVLFEDAKETLELLERF